MSQTDNVINWTEGDDRTRFHIDVGVAYGSDTELVKKVLLDVGASNPTIKEAGPISVQFTDFGDSSLKFRLLFWAQNTWEIEVLKSALRFKIDNEFKANNIRIPFPQRDVHVFEQAK